MVHEFVAPPSSVPQTPDEYSCEFEENSEDIEKKFEVFDDPNEFEYKGPLSEPRNVATPKRTSDPPVYEVAYSNREPLGVPAKLIDQEM
jgi:hypothetical protein